MKLSRKTGATSARAAARVVALTLISNGRVQSTELAALEDLDATGQLALSNKEWRSTVLEFYADLLLTARRGRECLLDSHLIERLLDAVDEPELQRRVLRLCAAVARADGHVDEGEAVVLLAAIDRWGLHADEQSLLESLLHGLDFKRERVALLVSIDESTFSNTAVAFASRRRPSMGVERTPSGHRVGRAHCARSM